MTVKLISFATNLHSHRNSYTHINWPGPFITTLDYYYYYYFFVVVVIVVRCLIIWFDCEMWLYINWYILIHILYIIYLFLFIFVMYIINTQTFTFRLQNKIKLCVYLFLLSHSNFFPNTYFNFQLEAFFVEFSLKISTQLNSSINHD